MSDKFLLSGELIQQIMNYVASNPAVGLFMQIQQTITNPANKVTSEPMSIPKKENEEVKK